MTAYVPQCVRKSDVRDVRSEIRHEMRETECEKDAQRLEVTHFNFKPPKVLPRKLQNSNFFISDPQEGEAFTNMVLINSGHDDDAKTGMQLGEITAKAKESWLDGFAGMSLVGGGAGASGSKDIVNTVYSAPPTPVAANVKGVLSTKMLLTGLTTDWAQRNQKSLADAIRRTLEMSEDDTVLILGISSVTSTGPSGISSSARRRLAGEYEEIFIDEADHAVLPEGVARSSRGPRSLTQSVEKKIRTFPAGLPYPGDALAVAEWMGSKGRRSRQQHFLRTFGRDDPLEQLTDQQKTLRKKIPWRFEKEKCPRSLASKQVFKASQRRLVQLQAAAPTDGIGRRGVQSEQTSSQDRIAPALKEAWQKEPIALKLSNNPAVVELRRLAALEKLQINFEVRLTSEALVTLTQTRLSLLASGSPKISASFLSKLDEELVSRGEQPVKLDANRLSFDEPVMVLSPDENFFGTQPPMTVTVGGAGTNTTTAAPAVVVKIHTSGGQEGHASLVRSTTSGMITPQILAYTGIGVLGVFLMTVCLFCMHLRRNPNVSSLRSFRPGMILVERYFLYSGAPEMHFWIKLDQDDLLNMKEEIRHGLVYEEVSFEFFIFHGGSLMWALNIVQRPRQYVVLVISCILPAVAAHCF